MKKRPTPPKQKAAKRPARRAGMKGAPVVRQLPVRTKSAAGAGQDRKQSSLAAFEEIVALIERSRREAGRAVNVQLIELYWKIGAVISSRIERDGWGKGTVAELAAHLASTQAGTRGFSPQNLWRMRQFFEAYRDAPVLSTLLRELPWSAHLHILSGTKRPQEREFYLRLAASNRWPVRELARQIASGAFARVAAAPKLSTALRVVHPEAADQFKDVYSLEFLGLSPDHSEADLHRALLRDLGRFINELGRDFCFVGSEYPVQVGNQDFAIDLVFFHRGLTCLVTLELKVREFRAEDFGKLSFYLEALDRDVKKPHERASIGVLLCANKDNEVVEYALSRTLSQQNVTVALGELGGPHAELLPVGAVGARIVPDIPTLHLLIRRAFQLSKSLPDELLHVLVARTATLPRTTEAERLVVQRVGQDIFRQGLLDYCSVKREQWNWLNPEWLPFWPGWSTSET